MISDPQLRPEQEAIIAYRGGLLGVSAVPGSGKTFTLSLLAAELIASGLIDFDAGQEILIVTYLNTSVDTFRARVRHQLERRDLPQTGFDVRTLHSLALEIVTTATGGTVSGELIGVSDEVQTSNYLSRAFNRWIEDHPEEWHTFTGAPDNVSAQARWRQIMERTAASFIRTAKNSRYRPSSIQHRLEVQLREMRLDAAEESTAVDNALPLVWMLSGVYARYQDVLARQAALDFDDLIWQAADLLESRPDLANQFRKRWPYVLEDEAQDSVPLQEVLLSDLVGLDGNWVRVGDPNQAITSTFTSAHPRHFRNFLDRRDVTERTLSSSGRSAPRIFGAANALVHWTCNHHPVPEVRANAFRPQDIRPTAPGDIQPNPADAPGNVRIEVYGRREEEEIPAIAVKAHKYALENTKQTLAILVPTNQVGYRVAQILDELDAGYDNLLRGGGREREIATAIHALLALLADPLSSAHLVDAHQALVELGHPAVGNLESWQEAISGIETGRGGSPQPPALEHFHTLLRSVHLPERLLFPDDGESADDALPAGVVTEHDRLRLEGYRGLLQRVYALRSLPVADLVLALGEELFAVPHNEQGTDDYDLAIAFQLAGLLRRWRELQPEWRLPELAAHLGQVATGQVSLPFSPNSLLGFEPEQGRITLATQHGAKGLEWDAVFLIGIDGFWIPGTLDATFLGTHDFLGGDPSAEATAGLRELMEGESTLFRGRTATESAHIELICERLRLLYVGVTRARRYLHISRSRAVRRYGRFEEVAPATALGAIFHYLESDEAKD